MVGEALSKVSKVSKSRQDLGLNLSNPPATEGRELSIEKRSVAHLVSLRHRIAMLSVTHITAQGSDGCDTSQEFLSDLWIRYPFALSQMQGRFAKTKQDPLALSFGD